MPEGIKTNTARRRNEKKTTGVLAIHPTRPPVRCSEIQLRCCRPACRGAHRTAPRAPHAPRASRPSASLWPLASRLSPARRMRARSDR